jgi:hypothetical protein
MWNVYILVLVLIVQSIGKFATPQSPWRWDDQINELVHDRDLNAEKTDINADTASERIDLWNLSPEKRPYAYKKYPLEVSKDKKIVSIGDIVRKWHKYIWNDLIIFN